MLYLVFVFIYMTMNSYVFQVRSSLMMKPGNLVCATDAALFYVEVKGGVQKTWGTGRYKTKEPQGNNK